jgi:hypothetical protein
MPRTWTTVAATDPLARLEERVRWLTALCAFLTVGFVALLAWQFYPRPSVLEANRFVLRDDLYRRRGELALRGDGAPSLRLYNPEGKTRLSLALPDDGSGSLWISDAEGKDRARFGLRADGSPMIVLVGANGEKSWRAP